MRKIKGLRWYMIALVTLGTVLGYLTRNTVAAAAPTLMEELHISTQQYSYIIAAYSAAYTVMQPVAGYVLYWRHDRAAVGGVGDCHAQLADGVHHLRGIELRLGHRLAYLLQTPARPEKII